VGAVMTAAQEQRRAQMAAAAARRLEPDARPAGRTAIRSKPVRITLDPSPLSLSGVQPRSSPERADDVHPAAVVGEVIRRICRRSQRARRMSLVSPR
ncbi:MAG TPA: hypothetical protein VLW50_33210, partial [Streptosporangiaceae bacterium]|nr:hypothetical protein [Streptosporangiaceae bacterium]